jgi:hypothetical protein
MALALAALAAIVLAIVGSVHGAGSDGCVRASEHGAVGDGQHDDTAALQQAIFAAFNATVDVRIPGWHNEPIGPDLCLEPGDYMITDTLNFTHSFAKPSGCAPSLRALGGAAIRMNSSSTPRDILSVPNAFHWSATGITFIGGRTQLLLGNNNTDEAMILIDSCTFHSSTGAAIRTEKPTPGERGGSAWPASQPLRNRGTFSTQITVRDCKFIGCNQVLVNWGDWTTIEDCWVTTSPTMSNDTAVFENWDRLFLKRILGVPGVTTYALFVYKCHLKHMIYQDRLQNECNETRPPKRIWPETCRLPLLPRAANPVDRQPRLPAERRLGPHERGTLWR